MVNKAFTLIFLSFLFHSLCGNKTLVSVVALTRHGDRYPLHKSPYYKNQDYLLGELTEDGMMRCYNVGASLRKRYGSKFFSFDDYEELKKQNNNYFSFHSTDKKRTRESLQYYLQGMFNVSFKPVEKASHIFSPINISSKIRRKPCKEKENMPSKLFSQEALFNTHRLELIDFQKKIGMEKPDLFNVETVNQLDTLQILHTQLNFSLPDGIEENQFKNLLSVYRELEKNQHPYFDPNTCLGVAGDYINEVFFEYPKQIVSSISSCVPFPSPSSAADFLSFSNSTPRYGHFSAHDSTIIEKLGCLGFDFSGTFPEYSSTLLVEMYIDEKDVRCPSSSSFESPSPTPPPPPPTPTPTVSPAPSLTPTPTPTPTPSPTPASPPSPVLPPSSSPPAPTLPPSAVSFRVLYDLEPAGGDLKLQEWLPARCRNLSPCPGPLFTAPFRGLAESVEAGEYGREYCFYQDEEEKSEERDRKEQEQERERKAEREREREREREMKTRSESMGGGTGGSHRGKEEI